MHKKKLKNVYIYRSKHNTSPNIASKRHPFTFARSVHGQTRTTQRHRNVKLAI